MQKSSKYLNILEWCQAAEWVTEFHVQVLRFALKEKITEKTQGHFLSPLIAFKPF